MRKKHQEQLDRNDPNQSERTLSGDDNATQGFVDGVGGRLSAAKFAFRRRHCPGRGARTNRYTARCMPASDLSYASPRWRQEQLFASAHGLMA